MAILSRNFIQGSVEEVTIIPGEPGKAVGYCSDVKECKDKVTQKDRGLEPVEVLPQSATSNNIQRATTEIPDTFVVVDGSTYYVSSASLRCSWTPTEFTNLLVK